MNLIHAQVQHWKYGAGYITEQTDTQITVEFAAPHGAKKFLYPMAFASNLTLSDLSMQAAVTAAVQALHEQDAAKLKQLEDEAELLRVEKSAALLKQKHPSAKKRTPSAKRTACKKATAKLPKPTASNKIDSGTKESED
ncbi:MAG: hypothetical protein VB055_10390 [Oscillospiraceae bacterium]|nr:hypothetical protein [Oscillospiraceae bacterium]